MRLTLIALVCALVGLSLRAEEPMGGTLTGADQILSEKYLKYFIHKKVGVIAHHASRDRSGKHLVDLLHESPQVDVRMIFSPEHGFRGLGDARIPDSVDPKTGLPIVSLYGPRKAPEKKHLEQLDLIVLDLQDVGVRYYTYATTMALAMKAAGENDVEVVVLDRPNPIGGELVEGAVLEEPWLGHFEAFYPVATRHGMTMGELARLYVRSFGVQVDLRVVPMKNWDRRMRWPETGLKWISPSPALPTYEQALLYSSFGALETFPLAVGRGKNNNRAFKIFGAPWVDEASARELVNELNNLHLSGDLEGLRFSYVQWTPDRREYQGELCRGFEIRLTGQALPHSLKNFLSVSLAIKKVWGKAPGRDLVVNRTHRAAGASWLGDGIENGADVSRLLKRAAVGSKTFLKQREAALIYK